MLTATGSLFTIGVGLFIYDFFRYPPRFAVTHDAEPELRPMVAT
jgi:nitric oxide reductase subunit B